MFSLFKKKPADERATWKAHNMERLRERGIRTIDHLPLIDPVSEAGRRTSRQAAERLVALWEVLNNALGTKDADKATSVEFLREISVWNALTPMEQNFLLDRPVSEQDVIDLSWRGEEIKVLYWALDEVEVMGDPVEPATETIYDLSDRAPEEYGSIEEYLDTPRLRPLAHIGEATDFYYRLHWAARQKHSLGDATTGMPDRYQYGIIMERHSALLWLCDASISRDEVSTDT